MGNLSNAENTLLKIKEHIPFFAHLSDSEVLVITHNVQFKRYNKFEMIFEQDSKGNEAYIVLRGKVNISVGELQRVGLLERFTEFKTIVNLQPKAVFGEMSAITGEKRSARASAYAEDTMLLSFKIDDNISSENAKVFIKLYKKLIEILSDKLRKTNQTALNNNRS